MGINNKNRAVDINIYHIQTLGGLKSIFLSARNCYTKDGFKELIDDYDSEKAKKLFAKLLKMGHESIFEHVVFQLYLENVSRSFLAQFSRHRIGVSLSVKSQHFIDHDNFNYKKLETDNKDAIKLYEDTLQAINMSYAILTDKYNLPVYVAREILPNACVCNIYTSINLRAMIHFFQLRLPKQNTPEIRKVFKDIYLLLEKNHKDLFEILEEHYNFKSNFI